ncbi:hypothetical protein BD310DRAFT_907616 [Dichomitus squalens]|uniref:Arrestin-like N-terminal domain-containing protein n=1 Tax=Dichomitus squalens TaxID=114155 RepID=A0A4Q9PQQ6_9APHY|nr:hypothetical protein BD310DRAFT_907616 [Dichomitus squalens]
MAGTPTQTRPEPMNASPYHSKVKVTLKFADHQFPAGGLVTGKMEMECKAEKGLGIGVIMVELYAIEELTSRDHSATSTFLHTRRLFQGPGLPPSNSVHPFPSPGDPPLPSNYYHARRGITTFFFQIPLPESSPSSIEFGSGLARLRYEVRASVGVSWKGENKLVTDKKPVDVVELFEDDLVRGAAEGIVVGENGKIWMQGKVLGGFMVAGQPACIELQVKNHSTKKNSGLSVTLTRDLYLPNLPTTQKQPLQINDTVTSVNFRGPEYIIPPGVEGVANLVVDVPKHARGVKGGRRIGDGGKFTESLFEVRCTVGIKLSMGIGSKDIKLDLPVKILDPSVVPDYPPPDMYAIPPSSAPLYDPAAGMLYQPPTSPAPYMDRSMSPYAYPALPMSPPMSPPIPAMSPPPLPYVDQGQVWLPASHMPFAANVYGQPSFYAYPGSNALPLVPPPRPSSAEPTPSQPLHTLSNAAPGIPNVPPSAIPLAPLAAPALIPMPTGGKSNAGHREEGKGERASRISHHLRMSSRHRSVSPPAHRYGDERHNVTAAYPHATIAAPRVHANLPPGQTEAYGGGEGSASSSPELHTRKGLTLSPLHTGGSVVSPRPMLSPKLSFSRDPFEQVTQVENLERIAAAVDGTNPGAGAGAPALVERHLSGESSRDKTLPKPPAATGKGKEIVPTPRERADTLFPPSLFEAGADETPPTPTLAAVTSLKVPRLRSGGPGEASTGLDALEARLLAEVGTRKPEKGRAPDVRSVLPLPEPIAIPRAQDVEPPVDSAISSLTLGGLEAENDMDADAKTLKRGKFSRGGGSDRGRDFEAENEDLGVGLARDSNRTTRGRDSQQTDMGKKATGSGGAKKREDKHSSKHATGADGPGKDKELQKLRKAAQGRITAWLGGIDPEAPPENQTPPPETPPPEEGRGRSPGVVSRSPAAKSPAASPGRSLAISPGRSPAINLARSPAVSPALSARNLAEPPALSPKGKKSLETFANVAPSSLKREAQQEQEAQAAPNPRSSGFLPIGTVRAHAQLTANGNANGNAKQATPLDAYLHPKALARLGLYPPRSLDPEVKYDIRSARGGKGGIVASVAAIWASQAQSSGAVTPKPKPTPEPVKKRVEAAKLVDQWKATATTEQGGAQMKSPLPVTKPKPEGLRSPTKVAADGLKSPTTGAMVGLRSPAVAATTGLKSANSSATTPPASDGRPKALRPLNKTTQASPTVTSPSSDPMITSVADLTARRARMIKSTSVPAVISSSTATPMLSSTASLARPSPARAERTKMNVKLPPTISEVDLSTPAPKAQTAAKVAATTTGTLPTTTSPGSPPAKADYAFGQARLRELIKRYQGQVTSS